MKKIDLETVSLECVAQKVNEIVDALNSIQEERIAELSKRINLIKYGKLMTEEEFFADIKIHSEYARISGNPDFMIGITNGF